MEISTHQEAMDLGDSGRLVAACGSQNLNIGSTWQKTRAHRSNDPIDDYTRVAVDRCLQRILPPQAYRFLYPGNISIGLQQLGELAGWHHPSPFAIGIDAEWGSWFAYRALVLAGFVSQSRD